jgi:enterochelin esterase family protein
MYKAGTIVFLISLFCILSTAQEPMFAGNDIVSPELNQDRTVTFRVRAVNASEVLLSGDWMPRNGWVPGSVVMERNENGIWEFTSEPLEPDLYSYTFVVDGFWTTDPNNPFLIRDVANIFNIFIVDGGQADLYKIQDVAHGSVARRWYDSPSLEMDRRITIYTPPGYEKSSRSYPVLYLLHGGGGDEEAWISLGRTAQILDNLIAMGKAVPMIVVMPNGNVIQDAAPGEGHEGFYKPRFIIPKTMDGTFIHSFQDIISFVEDNYRVRKDKSARAIAGLSMGGFHAIHISRFHQNTFAYIGSFSAAIVPSQNFSHEVFRDAEEGLKQQLKNGIELYYIAIGRQDFLYPANLKFRDQLNAMGFNYVFKESDGGHTWSNWRLYLSEFVPLLFKKQAE